MGEIWREGRNGRMFGDGDGWRLIVGYLGYIL